ncbi:RHS repeat-associated core domain-containing protein, partial [Chryseobacterium gallinarum]|uniref:RHS repeat-associated core domain-containing protein n=1 Tax=Chryseobacterium gallinarum TaxID=1324352 RepID=UPI0020257C77
EILEENNYYLFGLKHEGYNVLTGNSAYNYKYNGKELQETGMYDYGARMYMPDLGRWFSPDPLSEEFRRWSPYNYAMNNPIRFIDPDGRQGTDWIRQTSNGVSTWTYDPNIKTTSQAEAADYKNVEGVYSSATISSEGTLGIGGYSYSLNSDGSVTNNSDGSSINNTFVTGAGTTINAPSGTFMSEWKMDRMEKWANSDNFAAKFTYGIANSAYVTAQIFDGGLMERSEWSNPLGGNYGNLDGTPNYQQADAFVNTASTVLSSVRGLKAVTSAAPEGLTIAKLSASQFSSTFKGTAISRAAPATRGLLNRSLNKGIGVANGQMRSGTKALTITKGAGNLFNPDKKE